MHGPPRDLYETHKRQVEETMETLAEGPEGFYKTPYWRKNASQPDHRLSRRNFRLIYGVSGLYLRLTSMTGGLGERS